MAQMKYKCQQCSKEFIVKYIFIKPQQVNCPYCGSTTVREDKSAGCGCAGGSRFT